MVVLARIRHRRRTMMSERTFESNDRHVQEDLIDPGPIPEITVTRPMQKELRKSLKEPAPIREGY
jgi:hypothetical protein